MGFSFHVTTMFAGQELKMHYQNHLEAVLVLKGTGTIEDLGTGLTHTLAPGVMYALNANDQHVVRPTTDLLTACVFNPLVTGRERSEEHTSELQSLMRISYAVFRLQKKKKTIKIRHKRDNKIYETHNYTADSKQTRYCMRHKSSNA